MDHHPTRATLAIGRLPSALRQLIVAALLTAGAVGCAGPVRVFVNPQADFSYYTKVGIVPFRTLAGDRFAGEKFTVEFNAAVLAAEMFEVVEYGIFATALDKAIGSRARDGTLTPEELKKIAEATGVQGVFLGTVSQYEMVRTSSGTFPVITVEARLVDTETGTVAWMATATQRGGPKAPVISIGEIHTLGELSQVMSRRLVSTLK